MTGRGSAEGNTTPFAAAAFKESQAVEAFAYLVSRRAMLADQAKGIETERKQIDEELKAMHEQAGEGELIVEADGKRWKSVVANGGNSRIDARLLLEQGVRMEQIEKATVKKGYQYMLVTEIKAKGGEGK